MQILTALVKGNLVISNQTVDTCVFPLDLSHQKKLFICEFTLKIYLQQYKNKYAQDYSLQHCLKLQNIGNC